MTGPVGAHLLCELQTLWIIRRRLMAAPNHPNQLSQIRKFLMQLPTFFPTIILRQVKKRSKKNVQSTLKLACRTLKHRIHLTGRDHRRRRRGRKKQRRRRRRRREATRRRVGSGLPPTHNHMNRLQLVRLLAQFLHLYFFSPATPSRHNK